MAQPPLLLRRHSLIPMVKSAEDRRGDQLGAPDDRSIGLGLWNRRVAIESLVRPSYMVVVFDELTQQPLQVALAQDDHMIQKLSAKGAPESFDDQILSRRPVRNPHLLDVAGVEELPHPAAIDAVVVEEEISRLLAVGHGFPQLLNHPAHRRVGRDRVVNDFAATVM